MTLNYYLRDRTAEKTAIYLLFRAGGQLTKFYTGETINPEDWNVGEGRARKSYEGFSAFNDKLQKIQDRTRELYNTLTSQERFTELRMKEGFQILLDKINGVNKVRTQKDGMPLTDNLADFAEWYLSTIKNTRKPKTIRNYSAAIDVLREYEGTIKRKITFEDFDANFYEKFLNFLTVEKKYGLNTIGNIQRPLKTFANVSLELGLHNSVKHKSRKLKNLKEDSEQIYLSEKELGRMFKHNFAGTKYDKVRDAFLVMAWGGFRYSDLCMLSKANIINNKFIKVATRKTGEVVTIPIHPVVAKIIKKYDGFPQPISSEKMNKYLKDIGKAIGLTDLIAVTKTKAGKKTYNKIPKFMLLSCHTGRRSAASNLSLRGAPEQAIMQITGHRSSEMLRRYTRGVQAQTKAETIAAIWKNRKAA